MRVLVFGMSGDKLGGINCFLTEMNKHMTEDCVFDYMIEGPNCISKEEILKKGGKITNTRYFRDGALKKMIETTKLLKQKRKEYDVAYFNLFSLVHVWGIVWAKLFGYKIILHAHNNNIESKGRLYSALHYFNRALLKPMKCLRLTTSELSTEFMYGKGMKAELVYNAVDVEQFCYNEAARVRIRKELDIEDKMAVGFVGRIAYQKNPLFLIDTFREIHARRSDAVLVVAGDGDLREQTEQHIREYGLEDSVRLLGVRKDIRDIYQAMDVFLLPSRFEGLGIVLIEAQAAGLGCVTSADVVPNIVQLSEETLRFVSLDEDPAKWAEEAIAIADIPCNRKERNRLVQDSNYNITREALRMQEIITSY